LSDLENSEFCDHYENYSCTVHSIRSDSDLSDDESKITWYDAENTDEPCEPKFCEQNGHSSADKSEHNSSDSDIESTHQPIACFLHDWASKHDIPCVALNEQEQVFLCLKPTACKSLECLG